jgi:tripartite-type tricarboxylate transporter receptor subunit TctC
MATNVRALAVRKGSSYKTIQDLINAKEKVKMGATGLGGSTYVDAVITMKAIGFPAEIIHGYDSSKEMDMGMLRGEIEILWGSYSSRRKMVKAGEQFIILQSGKKRSSAIPDVPTWFEVAPSEKAKQILTVLTAMHETGRPIAGPPGIAPERLEFLRKAFYEAMHDPDFLKDAKKAKRVLSYLPGKDMAQLAEESMIIEDEKIKQLFIDAIKGSI